VNLDLKIGVGAFWGCSGLTGEIKFKPRTLIGASAFSGCSGLTGNLDLSQVTPATDGPKTSPAYPYAFYGCKGLDGLLTLPSGINEIKEYTFSGCENLKSQKEETNLRDKNGDIVMDGNKPKKFMRDILDLTGITPIGAYAFENCEGFSGQLVLDTNIEKLGAGAFRGCSNLKSSWDWSPNKEDYADLGYAFDLKSYTQLGKTIEKDTFRGCKSLTGQLILPANVEIIGDYAFEGWDLRGR